MGTNFYMLTKNKDLAEKYSSWHYELTDMPDWGYQIHLAKTSCGWLPLFQAYKDDISSVRDIKLAYDTGEFIIYDEYGTTYTWAEFDERVLQFNGGRLGVQKPEKIKKEPNHFFSLFTEESEYTPISHLPNTKQSYNYQFEDIEYFSDDEGYEFTEAQFS